MRIAAAALAGLALVAVPGHALGQTTAGSIWRSVQSTVEASVGRMCVTMPSVYCGVDAVATINAAINNYISGIPVSACSTAGCTWMNIVRALGWPSPVPIGGMSGGGGASGEWENCADFDYNLDPSGNLIIPSIPLAGGGPMTRNTQVFLPSYGNLGAASSFDAAVLWGVHNRNLETRTDTRAWYGCAWRSASGSYTCRSVGYYNGATLVGAGSVNHTASGANNNAAIDCPQGGSEGGNTDFYYSTGAASDKTCISHAREGLGTNSGYFYSPITTIPASQWDEFPNGTSMQHPLLQDCVLDVDFLRRLTETLWQKAAQQPGYTGPPATPVAAADVQTDAGDVPTVSDLQDLARPVTNGEPTPYPTPTSAPTSSPTGSSYDPTVTTPELSTSDIDWWPDLPTIEVDLGSPACPTYPLSLPQWTETFVVDAHCALIEQNRALISTLMVTLFTIMSVFIVLRA